LTALVALVFTGLSFIATRDQIRIAVNGQSAERFTTAVEQIASARLEVRLGAIHALSRIAGDSPDYHQAAMEMLAAFVRTRAAVTNRPGTAPACTASSIPEDVVAALSAIGRRDHTRDGHPVIDLSGTCLNDLVLTGADLRCVNLAVSYLENAFLERVVLTGALLSGAHLAGVNLHRANLDHANLNGATLYTVEREGASLDGASLRDAYLTDADLTRADLSGANLDRALLTGGDFTAATLTGARLDTHLGGATFTGATGVDRSRALDRPPTPEPAPCARNGSG